MKRVLFARKLLLGVIAAGAFAGVFASVASAHTGTVTVGCKSATYVFDDTSFAYGGSTEVQTILETVSIDGNQVAQTTVQINPLDGGTTTSSLNFNVPTDGASHTVVADAFDQTTGFEVQVVTLGQGQTSNNGYFPVTQSLNCGPPPPPPCTPGTSANFRWHYSANGSSGSWSGTKTQGCGTSFSMGPQDMEGDQKLAPGTLMKVGYDFTVPGNNSSLFFTVSHAQVVFTVACVSGATPAQSTFTVTMPTQTYNVTNSAWTPSGDQQSPLVYQGSAAVPDLCGGGLVRFQKGGTFSATLS